MPVIKVNDQQYLLRPGPNRVGAGADVDIRVGDNATLGVQAIVDVDGSTGRNAVIRSVAHDGGVRVNGVPLVDPTPLVHGDKVEIGGRELLFADDSEVGVTQHVTTTEVADAAKRPGLARATAPTGGRLVSLVDGKEYTVPPDGLIIGRDAVSDVVVPQDEVSRRHAQVTPVPDGYEVRDLSANGVFVNGMRISTTQTLSRADVIRVGGEEFRFYADVAQIIPLAPAKASVVEPPATSRPVDRGLESPASFESVIGNSAVTDETPVLRTAVADERPVLALLEITNDGPTKGTRHEIRVPLAHVGRGAYNDVVIVEPSVSETHAKFERREDGWFLIDLGSTNGTFVSGQRLTGERAIYGGLSLRFGGVKVIFRPGETVVGADVGARGLADVVPRAASSTAASSVARPAPQITTAPPPAVSTSGALPRWVWSVVVLAVGVAVSFFLLNR